MHTLRVLTAREPPPRIEQIFLFNNGLNELDRTGLYYQLASSIIRESGGRAACILRPFPGHLTRARHARFAEQPLHRYLWDGSHLFNQFLRYMTETQWFLSALVTRSIYRCASGAELLAESGTPGKSRLECEPLSNAILTSWEALSDASHAAGEAAARRLGPSDWIERPQEVCPDQDVLSSSIVALRNTLGLDTWSRLGGDLRPAGSNDQSPEEPSFHVVGYSRGGFKAQTIFMSWPFLISSCSTLLSGGALRELSPTAFAHPEEWQTVLHSLRYEVDEGMLDGRYAVDNETVAGMSRGMFHYLQRTFYEVFQPEYRGSYESRLKAFRQRMLFVLGGDDPIVTPNSVLNSAPSGGMNAVEIAGLGHFLGSDPRGGEERQQREFWLPEVGSLIARFADEAASRLAKERLKTWLNTKLEVPVKARPDAPVSDGDRHGVHPLSDRRRLEIPGDGALSNRLFGLCLNDLLARQARSNPDESRPESGLLLVLRNEMPTLLLEPRATLRRARALYHDDNHIAKYCRDIRERAAAFRSGLPQATVVVPWNLPRLIERLDPPHRFPSQSETAVGHIAEKVNSVDTVARSEKCLADLADTAKGSVLMFDGRTGLLAEDAQSERGRTLVNQVGCGKPLFVPSLPDCWIWMHSNYLNMTAWEGHDIAGARDLFLTQVLKLTSPDHETKDAAERRLAENVQMGNVRLLTVSRARYNPRFRGRLVVEPRSVRDTLTHAALCVAAAGDYSGFERSHLG